MPQRKLAAATLSLWLSLLSAASRAQTGDVQLKPGDVLPTVSGQTLTGQNLELPSAAAGELAVVTFSFSHAAGRDAQDWAQRLSKDLPQTPLFTVIVLESAPRLVRGMAVSGIKKGMPSALHARTILLYRDEKLWKQRLHIVDANHSFVILIGPTGRIEWMSAAPYSDASYVELQKQVGALSEKKAPQLP